MRENKITSKKQNINLFVTFPVDFGNQTLEKNLKFFFSDEMDFFRFAGDHVENSQNKISFYKSVFYRLKSTISLRKRVSEIAKNGGYILFQNLSPALFSYGVWKGEKGIVVLDWTRTLRSEVYGDKIKKDFIFYLHQKIFNKCHKIFCWTDASLDNIQHVYGIDKAKLFKVPAPFLIEKLSIPPRETPLKPRVLFIGGDWLRKGGDVLINAWETRLRSKCELTILTSEKSIDVEGINVYTHVRYGTKEHKKIFEENDILFLPARFDAYPQVIGEAAAGGLAVVTTKFALGSPEIIQHGKSGFIAESPEESIDYLIELLNDSTKINSFKKEGYNLMQLKFSMIEIKNQYLSQIES
jgi:glycosyltransferase involved in cell wall biosynthesis